MIKVLIDENLPASLAAGVGPDALHATDLGARPSDLRLWAYAREHDRVILTQDADYFNLLAIHGPPPKVVWVRFGNVRLAELQARVGAHWSAVRDLLAAADLVILHRETIEAMSFRRPRPS